MNKGPLTGIRVTEFTSAWAGPYATCLLGFLGAEIVKVESRKRLDHARNLSFSTGSRFAGPNESSVFNNLNLNKKSVTLNLSKPKAIEIAKRLVGLRVTGRGIARHGYPLDAGERRTGGVTSGTQSPTLGYPIAMAYVAPGDGEPGTMLDVEIRDQRIGAEVVPLPFYRRAR